PGARAIGRAGCAAGGHLAKVAALGCTIRRGRAAADLAGVRWARRPDAPVRRAVRPPPEAGMAAGKGASAGIRRAGGDAPGDTECQPERKRSPAYDAR